MAWLRRLVRVCAGPARARAPGTSPVPLLAPVSVWAPGRPARSPAMRAPGAARRRRGLPGAGPGARVCVRPLPWRPGHAREALPGGAAAAKEGNFKDEQTWGKQCFEDLEWRDLGEPATTTWSTDFLMRNDVSREELASGSETAQSLGKGEGDSYRWSQTRSRVGNGCTRLDVRQQLDASCANDFRR